MFQDRIGKSVESDMAASECPELASTASEVLSGPHNYFTPKDVYRDCTISNCMFFLMASL